MKILHICLAGMVTDGMSYQENNLLKWHKKLGNEVYLITSEWIYNSLGDGKIKSQKKKYTDNNGVNIIRLPIKNIDSINYNFKRYNGIESSIEEINPDIIFVHGLQFLDVLVIKKYMRKTKGKKLFIDNHADYSNSARTILSKLLHRIIWRYCATTIEPYVTKFWGVLPSRVEFLRREYRLNPTKCDLLIMGADDELVDLGSRPDSIKSIKNKYHIGDSFLIVSGGKIDIEKKQIINLLEYVKCHNFVKMILFGSISKEMKGIVEPYIDNIKIIYVGWQNNENTYRYIAAADLAVFPGRHSVLWEQTVAQGIPLVCKYWEGTTHVDIKGNVRFLYDDSSEELSDVLNNILKDEKMYRTMKAAAMKEKRMDFLYSKIAKDAILN